jgi:glutathione S-transferase
VPELILHQYEASPYSEKVRKILAHKELPWSRVRAPAIMPKPDLTALTGGYRRIPVLQIENHVYCDTALIARVLEALAPDPPLYPTPLAQSVAEWFDGPLFDATVPFLFRPTRVEEAIRMMQPEELAGFGPDRAAMRDGNRPSLGYRMAKTLMPIYLGRIDRAVATSEFLLGDEPCIADFSAYHSVWILDKLAPEPLEPYAHLRGWFERMQAIEGEEPTDLTPEAALEICRKSEPWESDDVFNEDAGWSLGQPVVVRAMDYGRDPVRGTLVQSTLSEIALRREDPRAGVVYVHFPRIGYELSKDETA